MKSDAGNEKQTARVFDEIELLRGLVDIPSLSMQEAEASQWLVGQMARLGYERAYVDATGNAVGEIGAVEAKRLVVLLGHIDTVPGRIPVRIEPVDGEDVLFGRGSVDAKGPLATFVTAVSRLDAGWARQQDVRIVVVGAVEEEAATSRGARSIRDRFDGCTEAMPDACIIGEPSSWNRITLGYKGRLLIEIRAGQPMAHSAGPDAGVATRAVSFWNWLDAHCKEYNAGDERIFSQLQPSLRDVRTSTDDELNDTVWVRAGIRLPPAFDAAEFVGRLVQWCAKQLEIEVPSVPEIRAGADTVLHLSGASGWIALTLRGYEPAWKSERDTGLVRAFLGSIREHGVRPGFVVKTGTSDMNVVGPSWQCPILAYGPGDSSLDHTPFEHVSLAEYAKAIDVLHHALQRLPQTL